MAMMSRANNNSSHHRLFDAESPMPLSTMTASGSSVARRPSSSQSSPASPPIPRATGATTTNALPARSSIPFRIVISSAEQKHQQQHQHQQEPGEDEDGERESHDAADDELPPRQSPQDPIEQINPQSHRKSSWWQQLHATLKRRKSSRKNPHGGSDSQDQSSSSRPSTPSSTSTSSSTSSSATLSSPFSSSRWPLSGGSARSSSSSSPRVTSQADAPATAPAAGHLPQRWKSEPPQWSGGPPEDTSVDPKHHNRHQLHHQQQQPQQPQQPQQQQQQQQQYATPTSHTSRLFSRSGDRTSILSALSVLKGQQPTTSSRPGSPTTASPVSAAPPVGLRSDLGGLRPPPSDSTPQTVSAAAAKAKAQHNSMPAEGPISQLLRRRSRRRSAIVVSRSVSSPLIALANEVDAGNDEPSSSLNIGKARHPSVRSTPPRRSKEFDELRASALRSPVPPLPPLSSHLLLRAKLLAVADPRPPTQRAAAVEAAAAVERRKLLSALRLNAPPSAKKYNKLVCTPAYERPIKGVREAVTFRGPSGERWDPEMGVWRMRGVRHRLRGHNRRRRLHRERQRQPGLPALLLSRDQEHLDELQFPPRHPPFSADFWWPYSWLALPPSTQAPPPPPRQPRPVHYPIQTTCLAVAARPAAPTPARGSSSGPSRHTLATVADEDAAWVDAPVGGVPVQLPPPSQRRRSHSRMGFTSLPRCKPAPQSGLRWCIAFEPASRPPTRSVPGAAAAAPGAQAPHPAFFDGTISAGSSAGSLVSMAETLLSDADRLSGSGALRPDSAKPAHGIAGLLDDGMIEFVVGKAVVGAEGGSVAARRMKGDDRTAGQWSLGSTNNSTLRG
ncbi:hypothetical protein DFJ73DRAFT_958511 [Zopfochytrium polystomum]|nr:hypothetical protein DFJ73DRAFT_958511 [Zopfochytrium polystomum]